MTNLKLAIWAVLNFETGFWRVEKVVNCETLNFISSLTSNKELKRETLTINIFKRGINKDGQVKNFTTTYGKGRLVNKKEMNFINKCLADDKEGSKKFDKYNKMPEVFVIHNFRLKINESEKEEVDNLLNSISNQNFSEIELIDLFNNKKLLSLIKNNDQNQQITTASYAKKLLNINQLMNPKTATRNSILLILIYNML